MSRRQKLWRDLALIGIAPLLLYLLASLLTFSPADPGWSHSGSVTAPLHNFGGIVGAWIADVLLYLCGYVAFLLPVMLGLIAWIALFGMDTDGDGEADLGPALRLVGIVAFLVSSAGFLQLRIGGAEDFSAGSGGILGQLVGNSLTAHRPHRARTPAPVGCAPLRGGSSGGRIALCAAGSRIRVHLSCLRMCSTPRSIR